MHIDWDTEIDTPATIAVVGAGPVGVEAALYARFLGYSVLLFDARRLGNRQMAWGDYPLPSSWGELTSSLGLAALAAQGTDLDLPNSESRVTHRQYVEQYLLPVARTDLLFDAVQFNTNVLSISRTGCYAASPANNEQRADQEFRLLVDSRQLVDSQERGEYTQLVDIVLDCSGFAPPAGLASGGGLAIGERATMKEILVGKVDVLGKSRQRLAGKHALLYGRDETACANALECMQLAAEVPDTRATWILPKQLGDEHLLSLPASVDPQFANAALKLARNEQTESPVVSLSAWGIEAVHFDAASDWRLQLQAGEEETLDVRGDVLINCRMEEADWSFAATLPHAAIAIDECVTAEPNYYVLGRKGAASTERLTMPQQFDQIKKVFARIGGRAELDLYETVRKHNETNTK